MSTNLLAKALGRGVEIAAVVPYLEWRRRLESADSISDVVKDGESDQFATFDLMPVQELGAEGEPEIEIRILASDGTHQLTAYFYARPKPQVST